MSKQKKIDDDSDNEAGEATEESHDDKVARLMASLSAKQKEQAETDSDYKTELRRLQGDIDGIKSELKRTQDDERNRRLEALRAKRAADTITA